MNIRSVVGTIDIAGSDPLLETADAMVRNEFETSLQGRRRTPAGKLKSRGRR
jgi:hypothetical protein